MKRFNPLIFLASLGAGGIAVIPFAFLQYTFHTGSGLVKYSDIGHGTLSAMQELLFRSLEGVMIAFTLIHLVLTVVFVRQMLPWLKSKGYKELLADPLRNSAILAPFISIAMTMNVMIGPIRFFVPQLSANFQSLFLPALIGWSVIFVALMRMEIKLLKTSFVNGYDIDRISFGWLLHPFALGMVTVVGTGIAAMSADTTIAHIAAFMSLVSGSMGAFLLLVKLVMIFKSHFAMKGLPEKQFLPSFLIVIPNITLYAISAFRFGHYLENHQGMAMGPYYLIVIALAFAFQTWYLLFGLSLLRNFFTKYYFKNEFYVSQWGLICPIVAYAVLGSFFYKLFVPNIIVYAVVLLTAAVAVGFYLDLLVRQSKCSGWVADSRISCLS